jgi:hypothetical protein
VQEPGGFRLRLEEPVNLISGFKAKQAPQIWLIEMAQPVFFRKQGLQCAAGEIVIHAVAKPFGDVVGNVDPEFHAFHPTLPCPKRQPDQPLFSKAPDRICGTSRTRTPEAGRSTASAMVSIICFAVTSPSRSADSRVPGNAPSSQ